MSIHNELSKPFSPDIIHWRVGSTNQRSEARRTGNKDATATKGIALAYIDARDVMERLDSAVGPENWQCRYPYQGCCEIGIKIDGEWLWRANGAGVTDYEAEKGQYSDAFKRAGVMWGIGRYLYALTNEWVDIEPAGNSYKLKRNPSLPKWALPGYTPKMNKDLQDKIVEQVLSCINNADEHGLREILSELDQDEKAYLWRNFNSAQRGTIKEMLGNG